MIARLFVRLAAVVALLAMVAGIPWMLVTMIGWPLPDHLPSWDELTVVLTSPPTERAAMNALAVLAWVVWSGFVYSLVGELVAVARHGLLQRRAQPWGRNPARMVAVALFTAVATGSFAHTTNAASDVDPRPPVAVYAEVAMSNETAVTAEAASIPARFSSPETPPRTAQLSEAVGYRAALWEDPPPLPQAPGGVVVEIAGRAYDYRPGLGGTLWDLAEALLGDPRRWPEIRDLNPSLGDSRNGQVSILLPQDATAPVAGEKVSTTASRTENGKEDAAEQLEYEVADEDWMWHIAARFLGDEQRYTEIAALNETYAEQYPDFPDHIQPGDRLMLPPDAYDRGKRPHATGDTTSSTPDTQPVPAGEPADPAPAPPLPPGTPAPSPDPAPPPPPSPPASIPAPSPTVWTPASPTASPSEPGGVPGEQAEAGQPDEPESDGEPAAVGVALPGGAWVSFGLAGLIASAALLLRAQQRRRARLRTNPIPTDLALPEPVLPRGLRPVEDAGLGVLDFDGDGTSGLGVLPTPPAPAGAVGVDAAGGQVSLFDLPGDLLVLHGDGAASAVRAFLAAALGSGVSEHTGVQPRVVIPAGTLAGLLPDGVPAVGLDPDGETFDGERLEVVADDAAAVTRWEEEMLYRRRVCDQLEADSVGELVERDEHPEHLPPFLLVVEAASRFLPRLRAVALHRHALLLHTVLFGQAVGVPGWRVDPDGTVEASQDAEETPVAGSVAPVVRLSTLGAEELAAVLEVIARVAPRSEPGHDESEPAEALEAVPPSPETATDAPTVVPVPAGDEPAPVKLRVLGVPQLATGTGPITQGVRSGSVAVMTLLAAHPGGLGLDEIASTLHPGVDRPLARGRVHTDIDAARSLLRKATGHTGKARFVVYDAKAHRYALDPDLVEVDLWRMLTCIETANRASDDETAVAALRQAVSFYGGDFASGFEQTWALEHGTTIRRTVTSAWARIAEILEADRPDEAAAALECAVELEPVNEELYRRLMRIHGRRGEADQVRATFKLLARRLAELGDCEPSASTRRVAQRQLHRAPARPPAAPTPSAATETVAAPPTLAGHHPPQADLKPTPEASRSEEDSV